MDEAWCPVCDRLIPPNKLQIFPDEPSNKPSTSSSPSKDAADLNELITTTATAITNTNTAAPTQRPHQQQQRRPAPPKRAKSKTTQLKRTTSSGKKLPAAKLGNLTTTVNANTTPDIADVAGAAQPPDAVHPDLVVAPAAQRPPSRRASTDASNANNSHNSKFASAASAPTSSTSAGKTNNAKNNKPSKPRTILTQPASLYCSERCRLADQRNYASGSVAGIIYSPSSSYTSSSFVTPPVQGVLSSSYPVTQPAAAAAGPAPATSRNSSQSRSRTRGGLSRHGSATIINTALANASASSSANPYYLASPLLSPLPSYHGHRSRRQSSYSQNVSDDEDGVPPSPVTYAYDPDRANSDYFRSLIRGGRQGYFTTPATVVPQTTSKDGETSSEGSGAPVWDYVAGGASGAGLSASAGAAGKEERHTTFGVQSMTNIHNNDHSSSSTSLLQLHGATPASASASGAAGPSSSQPRKSLLPKGGNGTSAPAYIPTNGYLTHFSSLSLNNPTAGSNGHGHGHGYGYPYPYPDRPPYNAGHGYGHGYGYGWGRESASSSSSRRRQRSRQRHSGKNKDDQVPSKEHEDSASTSTKKPERLRGLVPSRADAEKRLPLFALEPAYPGPLSSTSDSEESDGDEEGGFVMGGTRSHRRRRSSDENHSKVGTRAESMTTAPSTESVQALLASETASGSFPPNTTKKEMAAVVSAARRPIPSRRGTMTLEAHSKSSASLRVAVKNDKDVSSSRKMRHQRDVSKMGVSSTAPAMPGGGPLSSSAFSSTTMTKISPSSSRRHCKSSASTKARPEHQHGLLVHVALPRNSAASHSRSSSLGSTSTTLGCLGAAKLAPSVSNIDASGTLVAQATPFASGVLPPTIDDLLNSVPVHDVLPPRNDSSSRLRSQTHSLSNYTYQVGVAPRDEAKDPIGRHTRNASHTPAGSFRSRVRLGSLYEHEDGDAGSGAATTKPPLSRNGSVNHLRLVQDDGFALDLDTYVPTYPMEFLPGQLGEKRKKLFYFGGC